MSRWEAGLWWRQFLQPRHFILRIDGHHMLTNECASSPPPDNPCPIIRNAAIRSAKIWGRQSNKTPVLHHVQLQSCKLYQHDIFVRYCFSISAATCFEPRVAVLEETGRLSRLSSPGISETLVLSGDWCLGKSAILQMLDFCCTSTIPYTTGFLYLLSVSSHLLLVTSHFSRYQKSMLRCGSRQEQPSDQILLLHAFALTLDFFLSDLASGFSPTFRFYPDAIESELQDTLPSASMKKQDGERCCGFDSFSSLHFCSYHIVLECLCR